MKGKHEEAEEVEERKKERKVDIGRKLTKKRNRKERK
jgi:hypothetical protein